MNTVIATGIGSLPGTDADEATRVVAGELPDLPHVVELPSRGPGSDMVGRTMAMLAELAPDLAVETTPVGWRFSDAPGRVMRRATSWWAEDLDAAEQHFAGAPRVKAQICGPWTLAAAVEMRNGERAVRDHGACRELAVALADAAESYIRDIRRRIPMAQIVLQVDEPSLPTVLAGGVSTASGIATYRAVDPQTAEGHLAVVVEGIQRADALPWVHCCAREVPIGLMRRAGFTGLVTPMPTGATEEDLGRALDEGETVILGVVDPRRTIDARRDGSRAATRVVDQLDRWGFSVEAIAENVVLSPECGLAGTDQRQVRETYRAVSEAARHLRDDADNENQEP